MITLLLYLFDINQNKIETSSAQEGESLLFLMMMTLMIMKT